MHGVCIECKDISYDTEGAHEHLQAGIGATERVVLREVQHSFPDGIFLLLDRTVQVARLHIVRHGREVITHEPGQIPDKFKVNHVGIAEVCQTFDLLNQRIFQVRDTMEGILHVVTGSDIGKVLAGGVFGIGVARSVDSLDGRLIEQRVSHHKHTGSIRPVDILGDIHIGVRGVLVLVHIVFLGAVDEVAVMVFIHGSAAHLQDTFLFQDGPTGAIAYQVCQPFGRNQLASREDDVAIGKAILLISDTFQAEAILISSVRDIIHAGQGNDTPGDGHSGRVLAIDDIEHDIHLVGHRNHLTHGIFGQTAGFIELIKGISENHIVTHFKSMFTFAHQGDMTVIHSSALIAISPGGTILAGERSLGTGLFPFNFVNGKLVPSALV